MSTTPAGVPLLPQSLKDWLTTFISTACIVGMCGITWWGPTTFPSVRVNHPVTFVVWAIVALLALVALVSRRKILMPWGNQAPLPMWGGLVAFAVLTGASAAGAFYILNGALDRTPTIEVPLAVIGRSTYRDEFLVRVTPADSHSIDRWHFSMISLTEADFERLRRGSIVVALVGDGVFGVPWLRGYRIPSVNKR